MLPNDPFILLSYINTELRDKYPSLDALCEDLQVERPALESKLGSAGFHYSPEYNRFG